MIGSAIRWPSEGYLGDRADTPGQDALAIEFILGGLEEMPPRGDIRAATKQCATLALGHSAPHAELHSVVECISKAIGAYDTSGANGLGTVLRGALHEEGVGI